MSENRRVGVIFLTHTVYAKLSRTPFLVSWTFCINNNTWGNWQHARTHFHSLFPDHSYIIFSGFPGEWQPYIQTSKHRCHPDTARNDHLTCARVVTQPKSRQRTDEWWVHVQHYVAKIQPRTSKIISGPKLSVMELCILPAGPTTLSVNSWPIENDTNNTESVLEVHRQKRMVYAVKHCGQVKQCDSLCISST